MKSNYRSYDHTTGAQRIRDYLDSSDDEYEERDSLPSRDDLTFSNGFYAYCSALFIDIRDSSKLPDKHTRPVLAKLFRSYISEMVAVFNSVNQCVEVNIVGDGVWAVFNTPYKADIDVVFGVAACAYSMVKVLNRELAKRSITTVKVGLGLQYGRVLMVKAGYNGSGLNDVVYMGDVVNSAAHLAAHGNDTSSDKALMVGGVFRSNLNDHNKALLTYNSNRSAWHGNVVNTEIEEWTKENY